MLEGMQVGRRLGLMVVGTLLSLGALIGVSVWTLYSELLVTDKHRLENVTEGAGNVFEYFHALEKAGTLSRQEAQRQAIAQLRSQRFDGDNYIFVYDAQAVTILSPAKPETEGQSMAGKTDPNGVPLFDRIAEVARNGQPALIEYMWNRVGADNLVPKASYVRPFQPWGWAYGAGIYLDSAHAAMRAALIRELAVAVVLMLVTMLLSWRVMRSILHQLGASRPTP